MLAYDAQWNRRLDSLESAVHSVVRDSWIGVESVQTAMSPDVSEAGRIRGRKEFTDVSGLFEMQDTTGNAMSL